MASSADANARASALGTVCGTSRAPYCPHTCIRNGTLGVAYCTHAHPHFLYLCCLVYLPPDPSKNTCPCTSNPSNVDPGTSSLWHWSPWLWAEVSHIMNSPLAPRTGTPRCGKLHEVGRFGVSRKHCICVSKLAHTFVHPQTAQIAHLLKMCVSNY